MVNKELSKTNNEKLRAKKTLYDLTDKTIDDRVDMIIENLNQEQLEYRKAIVSFYKQIRH